VTEASSTTPRTAYFRSSRDVPADSQRTRTFRPSYLMLSPGYQCNLSCPHCCVPIEWTDRLDIAAALRFLDDAHAEGIRTLGLTGGEPFLYPEFVHAVCRRAVELGLRFDRIMTNGVWHADIGHLESVLGPLVEMGYSGKLGLSIDKFHGMQTTKAAEFCRVAVRLFRRDNVVSLNYASRRPDQGLEPVLALAHELNAVVEWSQTLRRYLLVSPELTMTLNWNHLAPVERAERFDGGVWDGHWFEEDYCEGPGQALIVNPRGDVKPCCGFASDLEQLTIGNIYRDTVAEVIRCGREHPYVGKVFREGLTAIRDEILAHDPNALPGATSNHCYFCWYVLTNGLFDQTRDDPADRVGSDGSPWAKIRVSLPLAEKGPSACSASGCKR
jgi:organic radical activating enzyme